MENPYIELHAYVDDSVMILKSLQRTLYLTAKLCFGFSIIYRGKGGKHKTQSINYYVLAFSLWDIIVIFCELTVEDKGVVVSVCDTQAYFLVAWGKLVLKMHNLKS